MADKIWANRSNTHKQNINWCNSIVGGGGGGGMYIFDLFIVFSYCILNVYFHCNLDLFLFWSKKREKNVLCTVKIWEIISKVEQSLTWFDFWISRKLANVCEFACVDDHRFLAFGPFHRPGCSCVFSLQPKEKRSRRMDYIVKTSPIIIKSIAFEFHGTWESSLESILLKRRNYGTNCNSLRCFLALSLPLFVRSENWMLSCESINFHMCVFIRNSWRIDLYFGDLIRLRFRSGNRKSHWESFDRWIEQHRKKTTIFSSDQHNFISTKSTIFFHHDLIYFMRERNENCNLIRFFPLEILNLAEKQKRVCETLAQQIDSNRSLCDFYFHILCNLKLMLARTIKKQKQNRA